MTGSKMSTLFRVDVKGLTKNYPIVREDNFVPGVEYMDNPQKVDFQPFYS